MGRFLTLATLKVMELTIQFDQILPGQCLGCQVLTALLPSLTEVNQGSQASSDKEPAVWTDHYRQGKPFVLWPSTQAVAQMY